MSRLTFSVTNQFNAAPRLTIASQAASSDANQSDAKQPPTTAPTRTSQGQSADI
jgi:hypothetical protein